MRVLHKYYSNYYENLYSSSFGIAKQLSLNKEIYTKLDPSVICIVRGPAEPYRSNVRIAEPYRRESTPIIREPYSSNWTRDVNGELQLTFVFILEFWSTLTFF
ncbi:hypothetical protein GLOIN_2v1785135 [Rhizophagus irregularis DAOM 181602=DAOM 197198]|nr:hypothetical protein GLOIN_2v1785135 [Rhizophagus irregularis DAOM 181602=DAOM 197198]